MERYIQAKNLRKNIEKPKINRKGVATGKWNFAIGSPIGKYW
jgi:hypothetical protein